MVKSFKVLLDEERKESTHVVGAFLNRKPAKGARTHTDGNSLHLHGNKIAWHGEGGKIHATMAGWASNTTKERLNTITRQTHGKSMFGTKKGKHYFGDKEIQSKDVVDIKENIILPLEERYQVTITPYSLDSGKVGERNGPDQILSKHRSIHAAGRSLGSTIKSKAGKGEAGMYYVKDTHTGQTYTRNKIKSMKEEVEEITELSKKLLGRYLDRAVTQHGMANTGKSNATDPKDKAIFTRVVKNRRKGISRAIDRLDEEVEEISELSKKLLGRYVKKAHVSGTDAAANAENAYMRGRKGDIRRYNRKGENRETGINRAVKRLVKEDEVSLDEVSNELKKRYIGRAVSDIGWRATKIGIRTSSHFDRPTPAKEAELDKLHGKNVNRQGKVIKTLHGLGEEKKK